jgi:hypothetical protein
MDVLSPYRHLVDLALFLENECGVIQRFLSEANDPYSENPQFSPWAHEHILELLSRWSTGITTAIIRQDTLNEIRGSRSRQHVKPETSAQSTLHGQITGVTFFAGQDAAVIDIQQADHDYTVRAAVHGALLPFIRSVVRDGRKIHFANIYFSNRHMIPNQMCIIDLHRTKSDVDFAVKSTISYSLSSLDASNPPEGLLLRIEGPTAEGINVSDGPGKSIELHLERAQLGLRELLRFGDIVVLYRPWVLELGAGTLSLVYGPNTVMFRVPADWHSQDAQSQISQHGRNAQHDGLHYRNSAASRSVRGTVERVEYVVDRETWIAWKLVLCDDSCRTLQITVTLNDCSYDVRKTIAAVRKSHFVWIFGLIERGQNVLYFTPETTLFNPALMHSMIASDIVGPRELRWIGRYTTFVAKAIVVGIEAKVKRVHELCRGRVGRSGVCSVCKRRTDKTARDLVLKMRIDDGLCDPILVMGLASRLPFWSVTPGKWVAADESNRRRMGSEIVGKEFLFVLSAGDEGEFSKSADSEVWRVDQCIATVGDVEREVQWIRAWHEQMDKC